MAQYVKLCKEDQIKLLNNAILEAGSERKLKELTDISLGMIYYYKKGAYHLPHDRFKKILNLLELNEKDFQFELIDERKYRVKGGKAAYAKSIADGAFTKTHKKMRKASSKYLKKWHKEMKEQNQKEYYELQYGRFKKIGHYKVKTKKGCFVRNQLEKEVADKLFEQGIKYDYEPYLAIKKKVYFPDFVFGKTIIECTAWKGHQKALKLKKKIKHLESVGFQVFVVVPKALRCFYKPIEKNIIYLESLSNLVL